jgi:hypothetical protein
LYCIVVPKLPLEVLVTLKLTPLSERLYFLFNALTFFSSFAKPSSSPGLIKPFVFVSAATFPPILAAS